jgi:hypothetical protein
VGGWAGSRVEGRPLVVQCLALGKSKATLPFLGESSSLSPDPPPFAPNTDCDVSWIGKGVLGEWESANLTDLAGESSLGDPGMPAVLNDSIRKFLTDPLLESACTEPERGWWYEEPTSHEVVLDIEIPVPPRRP